METIVRKIDELGRIVLPAELRQELDLKERDGVEISLREGSLVLKRHEPSCIFCGGTDDIKAFGGKNICKACRDKISKLK